MTEQKEDIEEGAKIMNKEQPIKRLIELAETLSEPNQERLACVAQGMAMAAGMNAERKLSAQQKPA